MLIDHNSEFTGIIDWGDVHIGHPAVDLAAIWNVIPPAGHAAFLSEYGEIDEPTLLLAELRTIAHSAAALLFAHEVTDHSLVTHCIHALHHVLDTAPRQRGNTPRR